MAVGLAVDGVEPRGDLLARPAVIVVQVHDDRRERQLLLTPVAAGTAPNRALETVEEPIEILRGMQAVSLARQPIHALVRGTERARGTLPLEVVAICLIGAPFGARADERRQFLLAVMILL